MLPVGRRYTGNAHNGDMNLGRSGYLGSFKNPSWLKKNILYTVGDLYVFVVV